MKKSIKTIIGVALLAVALPVSAFASSGEKQAISGGWSESKGYYTNYNNNSSISALVRTTASSVPDSHTGKRLSNNINGSGQPVFEYAAFGATVWKDVYHYTTARMELSNGTVKTTSGRVWGTSGTTATSPWYLPGMFENPEARTYWGK